MNSMNSSNSTRIFEKTRRCENALIEFSEWNSIESTESIEFVEDYF